MLYRFLIYLSMFLLVAWMGLEGFLLILAGVFISFWGQFFVRLAVALVSGVWLGWLASALVTNYLRGFVPTAFIIGLLVFLVFFIAGFLKHRITAAFLISAVVTYYTPVRALLAMSLGITLSGVGEVVVKLLLFTASLILVYNLFKLLIGLITSSLGSLLFYAGLAVLEVPQTIALMASMVLFLMSLTWYLLKRERKL
ncbi:MAG: hypothetical protein QXX81_08100 [Zestosphaera sp.]